MRPSSDGTGTGESLIREKQCPWGNGKVKEDNVGSALEEETGSMTAQESGSQTATSPCHGGGDRIGAASPPPAVPTAEASPFPLGPPSCVQQSQTPRAGLKVIAEVLSIPT